MPTLASKLWIKILIVIFLINLLGIDKMAIAAEQGEQSIDVIQQEENKDKKDENLIKFVLFVTIDGLGSESVVKGYTPNLNGLAGSGIKTDAISVFPADTTSAVATILTGAVPADHKFIKPGASSKVISLPDLIAAKKQTTIIIDGKDGVCKGLSPKVQLLTNNQGDVSTMDLAIKEFEKKKPYFMQVLLADVDQANRKYGPGTPEHYKAVEEADKQVGRLLGKLHEYGLYQYSLVVVSGSYGVASTSSGKKYTANKEVLVPLYIKGPTIESGITIPAASLTNITPTIAYILGMKTSEQSSYVLWDILKNEGGASEAYLLKKRVKDLDEALIDSSRREYGLENEKLIVNDEKKFLKEERGKVQDIINAKDNQIKKREFKITLYKIIGFTTFLIFVIVLLLEYKVLKKKFLMFK